MHDELLEPGETAQPPSEKTLACYRQGDNQHAQIEKENVAAYKEDQVHLGTKKHHQHSIAHPECSACEEMYDYAQAIDGATPQCDARGPGEKGAINIDKARSEYIQSIPDLRTEAHEKARNKPWDYSEAVCHLPPPARITMDGWGFLREANAGAWACQ